VRCTQASQRDYRPLSAQGGKKKKGEGEKRDSNDSKSKKFATNAEKVGKTTMAEDLTDHRKEGTSEKGRGFRGLKQQGSSKPEGKPDQRGERTE